MRTLVTGIVLAVFWYLLSGQTEALFLWLGAASVVTVLWLLGRMDRQDQFPAQMVFKLEFLRYVVWLGWQLFRSNLDVARRIWDPSLPIQPVYRKIKVDIKDPLLKTIYANSITLTPGTVTVEAGEDYFWIHALHVSAVEELEQGEMQARIKRMEGGR